ncbi:uncharacterized protein LOC62_03G004326 [Vanrija pseudolonga]|uniref:Uncharacterized protein n=1 Tax=Vanrija pseudolonga TaxID=143232 RepID=A0AAF0YBX6_9TREE|nr:hypothetical protein LOC62_03G004326 [Vanrija pseudolonga]
MLFTNILITLVAVAASAVSAAPTDSDASVPAQAYDGSIAERGYNPPYRTPCGATTIPFNMKCCGNNSGYSCPKNKVCNYRNNGWWCDRM